MKGEPMTAMEMIERYKALHPQNLTDLNYIMAIKQDGHWHRLIKVVE